MKVISLTQPWASLIIIGAKGIETRGYQPSKATKKILKKEYLLIHASKTKFFGSGPDKINCRDLCMKEPFYKFIGGMRGYDALPFGAIIGRVSFEWAARTEALKERLSDQSNILIEHLMHSGAQELALGDYSPGRYGWRLDDPKAFTEPIPATGKLSIWDFDFSQYKHLL